MISESQERMLCVVEPDRLAEVLAVCDTWEVNATAIGEVTDSGRLRVFDGDDLVGDLPVGALVDECPAYDLEPARPALPIYPRRRACCPRAWTPAGRCSRCLAAPTSPRGGGRSSSTTASSARAPCGARRPPTPRS
jgi:phosphoribosylformylglycinamidine synthase